MTEAERLQKLVDSQAKEIRRLRRMLSVVRAAHVEYEVEGEKLLIYVTAIGCDDLHFFESAKQELTRLAGAVYQVNVPEPLDGPITDAITGEPQDGAVSTEAR